MVKPDTIIDDRNCIYSSINRLPSRDGYTIRTKCMGAWDTHQKVELRIVGKTLHYSAVPTVCGRVGDGMTDGFLNLRSGPGMRYAVTAKLITGDAVDVGETINGWAYVIMPRPGRNDRDEEIDGWVGSKYLVRGCAR